jgi:hypothetical protein
VSWILSGRRALGERRAALLARMAAAAPADRPDLARPTAGDEPGLLAAGLDVTEDFPVAVAGLSRYHRPGCPLTAGRAAERAALLTHVQAGRRPCGICTP